MGEVFNRHTDTVGNYRWYDPETGEHTIPASEYSNPSYIKVTDNRWMAQGTTSSTAGFGKFMGDPTEEQKPNGGTLKGWICPVCGRGLSPYTSVCPCKGFNPGWKVTC